MSILTAARSELGNLRVCAFFAPGSSSHPRKATVTVESKNHETETLEEDRNHDASNEAFGYENDCASDLDSVPAEHVLEVPKAGTI